ncbi:MAG: xanthan lyase [Deferribacteres bacterium]|nr:xanthan lyase [Deferribacteres bacterium]
MIKLRYVLFLLLFLTTSCAPPFFKKQPRLRYNISKYDKTTQHAWNAVDKFLQQCITSATPVAINRYSRIDTILIEKAAKKVEIHLTDPFSYMPFRPESVANIYSDVKKELGKKFRNYDVSIEVLGQPIEELIPNVYRAPADVDSTRLAKKVAYQPPLVTQLDAQFHPTSGLQGRHIALWPSHGWYYEQRLQRWEWQRARVFQTVEDLLPLSFVVPYLMPMLENAGANVLMPRERDLQSQEVIVDNDSPADSICYLEHAVTKVLPWREANDTGFAAGEMPYTGNVNPFKTGTSRVVKTDSTATASAAWIPDIPEDGKYYVSIAYAAADSHSTAAHYTVYHSGGKTEFAVNQQMGGKTWIYLGQFAFKKGFHPETQKVVLSNDILESSNLTPALTDDVIRINSSFGFNTVEKKSADNATNASRDGARWVSADAVRFGGGMGTISRGGTTSGRPRFTEAARYYMQFAGMPDTLVYNVTEKNNDYIDDYRSRGEWVNYLRGAPFGPSKNRLVKGLGIPIDLSLAFHTDAGYTRNDTTVGTLLIYSSTGSDSTRFFPDFVSRFASRDFTDILQTQLVDDIRSKYDPIWTRRGIWDRDYSEAYRPNVPAALLELLSHHNFLDMKFALDPRFRFDASRSIYKAMLKFLSIHNGFSYVVQPLPVDHFSAEFVDSRNVVLHWKPVSDPLEPTAEAQNYIVYTRVDSGDFDNGQVVFTDSLRIDTIQTGKIYSYKVTAVNAGGQSMPSEILSISCADSSKGTVLIVNAFDRVAAAATVEEGNLLGFVDLWDQGVPDRYDLNYIGQQYMLDANSKWIDDDAPGHGASYANYETKIIAGNTFDFPFVHGTSLRNLGYTFVSCSDEAVESRQVDLGKYAFVDFILGEEKETPAQRKDMPSRYQIYTPELRQALTNYVEHGGNLFISGSYIGSDLIEKPVVAAADSAFAKNTLKFIHRTNWAARSGGVLSVDKSMDSILHRFEFNTELNSKIYAAEAPDGIEPANKEGRTILRYEESNISAAVGYKGRCDIVLFGFPFETILGQSQRDAVMRAVMKWFE